MKSMTIRNIIGIIILIAVIVVSPAFNLVGEWLWFLSLGLESVFLTIFFTSLALGLATGLVFLAFSFVNIKLASKKSHKKKSPRPLLWLAALLALVVGASFASQWSLVLRFLESTAFAGADPVFGLNIGFFVFDLPFFGLLLSYGVVLVVLTLLLTLGTYFFHHYSPKPREEFVDEIPVSSVNFSSVKKHAIPHLSVLIGLVFFLIAVGFQLAQWALVLSTTGAIFGAGYTDVNIALPLFSILVVVAAIVGIISIANARIKRPRLLVEGVVAFVIVVIIGLAATGVVQALIVAPDEFNLEKPFIERNIQATLAAYGLDSIEERSFDVSDSLSLEDIEKNKKTIDNIRLWDFRPLTQTYNQLQLFRTYYQFNDVDIDRYMIDGELKEVMVSAREMDVDSLPNQAQTWVNQHLVYTHGYGVVMNPVDQVTSEGLPEFYIQDIPPQSLLPIERNEIYFGEGDLEYALVKTTTEELDYPTGEENTYTTYEGQDGIPINGINRLVYAITLTSPEILFSSSIQPESRLLIHRNIFDRIQTIAPFLTYDTDPYIVLADGRLYWILDAYTTAQTYPYSEPYPVGFLEDINYVRNSVKVVVDAYHGDVSFYVIEPEDPVIATYGNIFPELFTPIEQMPPSLREHIRYPEGLFRIQAEIYSTFHMKDPRVFYNKEDVWVAPEEVYRGRRQEMIPYYVILRLPGQEEESFMLIQPFVPRGKDNMIGWMAAASDDPNYGTLTVYRFSKQELVYGPLQIEARIDQNTEISAFFTLWSQSGSSVIRGNTLVIPIEDSILYIEPVFLEATEKGTLPQLQRVIVAFGDRLTMQPTLDEALEVIFGSLPSEEPPSDGIIILPGDTPEDVLVQLASLYNQAQEALKTGNLGLYGQYMDQIGDLLESY